ncbi:MAG TPA: polyamine aminopropyltransferase [Sandaracinaceae bacterium]
MGARGLWYFETFGDRIEFGLRVTATLHRERSEHQLVEIFETPAFGKVLALDGVFMTSVGDEFFYHEMIAHPALCTAPRIERVLVIGGGDGGTAREVLRHAGVRELVLVEIDRAVVDACRVHLPELGAWDDPRLRVVIDDGVRFVREVEPASFDVVILDGSDPVGPAEGLFDRTFFENVRRALREDGVFVAQSESPMAYEETFYAIVRELGEVFGRAHPYFGAVPLYGIGPWTWTYASATVDPRELRLERAGAVEAGCRYWTREIHHAAFALPAFVRRRLEAG